MSDKDKEIFYLKSKLNCVLTAYQIQSWKCSQEREELRHNMSKYNYYFKLALC